MKLTKRQLNQFYKLNQKLNTNAEYFVRNYKKIIKQNLRLLKKPANFIIKYFHIKHRKNHVILVYNKFKMRQIINMKRSSKAAAKLPTVNHHPKHKYITKVKEKKPIFNLTLEKNGKFKICIGKIKKIKHHRRFKLKLNKKEKQISNNKNNKTPVTICPDIIEIDDDDDDYVDAAAAVEVVNVKVTVNNKSDNNISIINSSINQNTINNIDVTKENGNLHQLNNNCVPEHIESTINKSILNDLIENKDKSEKVISRLVGKPLNEDLKLACSNTSGEIQVNCNSKEVDAANIADLVKGSVNNSKDSENCLNENKSTSEEQQNDDLNVSNSSSDITFIDEISPTNKINESVEKEVIEKHLNIDYVKEIDNKNEKIIENSKSDNIEVIKNPININLEKINCDKITNDQSDLTDNIKSALPITDRCNENQDALDDDLGNGSKTTECRQTDNENSLNNENINESEAVLTKPDELIEETSSDGSEDEYTTDDESDEDNHDSPIKNNSNDINNDQINEIDTEKSVDEINNKLNTDEIIIPINTEEVKSQIRKQLNLLQMGKRNLSFLSNDSRNKQNNQSVSPKITSTPNISPQKNDHSSQITNKSESALNKSDIEIDHQPIMEKTEQINLLKGKTSNIIEIKQNKNFIDSLINKIKRGGGGGESGIGEEDEEESGGCEIVEEPQHQSTVVSDTTNGMDDKITSRSGSLIPQDISNLTSELIIDDDNVSNHSSASTSEFLGFNDTDTSFQRHNSSDLITLLPSISKSNSNNSSLSSSIAQKQQHHSAFISEELDLFMKENALETTKKMPAPIKRTTYDEALMYKDSTPPVLVCPQLPKNIEKPRTVAEKRQFLEKEKDIKYLMFENESTVFRELRRRRSRPNSSINYALIRSIQEHDIPFTRDCWKAACWLNTQHGKYYYQTLQTSSSASRSGGDGNINHFGDHIKLLSGRGNNQHKILYKFPEWTEFPISPPKHTEHLCTKNCNDIDFSKLKINNLIEMLSQRRLTSSVNKSQVIMSPLVMTKPKIMCKKEKSEKNSLEKTKSLTHLNTFVEKSIIKPAPLSQKHLITLKKQRSTSSLDLELGPLQIYELPTIKLEISPKPFSPLPDEILPYLKLIMPFQNLTENWANFAVSAVQVSPKTHLSSCNVGGVTTAAGASVATASSIGISGAENRKRRSTRRSQLNDLDDDNLTKTIQESIASPLMNNNKKKRKIDHPTSFTFDIPYCNNQKKILIRNRRAAILNESNHCRIFDQMTPADQINEIPFTFNKSISPTSDPVAIEVSNILGNMINSVAISLNESMFIKSDPDAVECLPEIKLDKKLESQEEIVASNKTKDVKTAIKTPYNKNDKITKELKRLNATIIDAQTVPAKENCTEDFCKLGCICNSLATPKHLINHCKRSRCIVKCECPQKRLFSNLSVWDNNNPQSMQQLRDRATAYLAREEKDFTATVVVSQGETIYIPSSEHSGKRNKKRPKRFDDLVWQRSGLELTDELDEYDFPIQQRTNQNQNQKSNQLLSKETTLNELEHMRHVTVPLIKLTKLDKLEPWCMIHCLYKCFCKFNSIDGKPFEFSDEKLPIVYLPVNEPQQSYLSIVTNTKKRQYTFEKTNQQNSLTKTGDNKGVGVVSMTPATIQSDHLTHPKVPKLKLKLTTTMKGEKNKEQWIKSPQSTSTPPPQPPQPQLQPPPPPPPPPLPSSLQSQSQTQASTKQSTPTQNLTTIRSSIPIEQHQQHQLKQQQLTQIGLNIFSAARVRVVNTKSILYRNKSRLKSVQHQERVKQKHSPELLNLLRKRIKQCLIYQLPLNQGSNQPRSSTPQQQQHQQHQHQQQRPSNSVPLLSTSPNTQLKNKLNENKARSNTESLLKPLLRRNSGVSTSTVRKLSSKSSPSSSAAAVGAVPITVVATTSIETMAPPAVPKTNDELLDKRLQRRNSKSHQQTINSSHRVIISPESCSLSSSSSKSKSSSSSAAAIAQGCSIGTSSQNNNFTVPINIENEQNSNELTTTDNNMNNLINYQQQQQAKYKHNLKFLNYWVNRMMDQITNYQKLPKPIRAPIDKALNCVQWDYLVQQFNENKIFIWEVGLNDKTVILALTIENVMPLVPGAICVINIKAVQPERLPLIAKLLKHGVINETSKQMAVLLMGSTNYWRLISFMHSNNNYLDKGVNVQPTPNTHPHLSTKIHRLFLILTQRRRLAAANAAASSASSSSASSLLSSGLDSTENLNEKAATLSKSAIENDDVHADNSECDKRKQKSSKKIIDLLINNKQQNVSLEKKTLQITKLPPQPPSSSSSVPPLVTASQIVTSQTTCTTTATATTNISINKPNTLIITKDKLTTLLTPPESNIQIVQLHATDLDSIYVPIPVIGDHRWLMLTIYDDFSHIFIPSWKTFLSLEKIRNALIYAKKAQKTVKISTQVKGGPDVYAAHNENNKIFFGPYGMTEPLDLSLYQAFEGKMILVNDFERLLSKKRHIKRTIGVWLYMKDDKVLLNSNTPIRITPPPKSTSLLQLKKPNSTVVSSVETKANVKNNDNNDNDEDDDCVIVENQQDVASSSSPPINTTQTTTNELVKKSIQQPLESSLQHKSLSQLLDQPSAPPPPPPPPTPPTLLNTTNTLNKDLYTTQPNQPFLITSITSGINGIVCNKEQDKSSTSLLSSQSPAPPSQKPINKPKNSGNSSNTNQSTLKISLISSGVNLDTGISQPISTNRTIITPHHQQITDFSENSKSVLISKPTNEKYTIDNLKINNTPLRIIKRKISCDSISSETLNKNRLSFPLTPSSSSSSSSTTSDFVTIIKKPDEQSPLPQSSSSKSTTSTQKKPAKIGLKRRFTMLDTPKLNIKPPPLLPIPIKRTKFNEPNANPSNSGIPSLKQFPKDLIVTPIAKTITSSTTTIINNTNNSNYVTVVPSIPSQLQPMTPVMLSQITQSQQSQQAKHQPKQLTKASCSSSSNSCNTTTDHESISAVKGYLISKIVQLGYIEALFKLGTVEFHWKVDNKILKFPTLLEANLFLNSYIRNRLFHFPKTNSIAWRFTNELEHKYTNGLNQIQKLSETMVLLGNRLIDLKDDFETNQTIDHRHIIHLQILKLASLSTSVERARNLSYREILTTGTEFIKQLIEKEAKYEKRKMFYAIKIHLNKIKLKDLQQKDGKGNGENADDDDDGGGGDAATNSVSPTPIAAVLNENGNNDCGEIIINKEYENQIMNENGNDNVDGCDDNETAVDMNTEDGNNNGDDADDDDDDVMIIDNPEDDIILIDDE